VTTLENAIDTWVDTIHGDGGVCPCCGRFGKVYGRTINENMARGLIWLVDEWESNGKTWVDVPKRSPRWLVRSNQLPTLRWWGCIERSGTTDPDQKHSGLWRPTDKGVSFVNDDLKLPKQVFTYANVVIGFSDDDLVTIDECFGKKFSYQEVMETKKNRLGMRRNKVIDLGIRDSMSGAQILAEASKWNWDHFVLIGWLSDPKDEKQTELDLGSEAEEIPDISTSRFAIEYHPNTDLGEVIILSQLAIDDSVQGIKETR